MARACGCLDLYPIRITRPQLQDRHLGIRSGAPDVGTRGEETSKPPFAGARTANRDKLACAIHAKSLKLTRDAGLWVPIIASDGGFACLLLLVTRRANGGAEVKGTQSSAAA